MHRKTVSFHPALAVALYLTSVFVHADVLLCRDNGGAITYTNEHCPDGSRSAEVLVGNQESSPPVAPLKPIIVPAHRARYSVRRQQNTDVATIRAARTALDLMDQQRLASHVRLISSN